MIISNSDPTGELRATWLPRTYLIPRSETSLQRELEAAHTEEDEKGRSEADLEGRILLKHRIACLNYAVGAPYPDVRTILGSTADAIQQLVAKPSQRIHPLVALSLWGHAAIIGDRGLWKDLTQLDINRLGSNDRTLRYTRMLTALFTTMQLMSLKRKPTVAAIAEYDKQKRIRRRIQSDSLAVAIHWSDSLRNMIAAIPQSDRFENTLQQHARYLEGTYTTQKQLLKNEGLLDIQALGIIALARTHGIASTFTTTPLPGDMLISVGSQ